MVVLFLARVAVKSGELLPRSSTNVNCVAIHGGVSEQWAVPPVVLQKSLIRNYGECMLRFTKVISWDLMLCIEYIGRP